MTLELRNISKKYGETVALHNISMTFEEGKIHALIGNNGTGKTTLIHILSGLEKPSSGEILIDRKPVCFLSPADARKNGIVACYQNPELFPELSVTENLFLGNEIKTELGLLNRSKMESLAHSMLRDFHLSIHPDRKLRTLPIPQQHLIQFMRTLLMDPKMLIIDELTDFYSRDEYELIFTKLRTLANQGKVILYITHRIKETLNYTDKITILRNGGIHSHVESSHAEMIQIADAMLGSSDYKHLPKIDSGSGRPILEVTGISTKIVHDISFCLHCGEAIGIAGLLGSGRTSLLRAIVGADPVTSGKIELFTFSGKHIDNIDQIRKSIAYIPENKEKDALFPEMNTAKNITIRNLKRISYHHIISPAKERIKSAQYSEMIGLLEEKRRKMIRELSNGEKQKALIARNAFSNCAVYIFDEATKGVDGAGRVEVYNIINEILRKGGGIILVSSDFEELIGMCDRILVIQHGELKKELISKNCNWQMLIEALEET